ncbi:MAG: lactate utilization protein C [Pirellulaceae bacterium]
MKREAFLQRVQQAAEAGRSHRVSVTDHPDTVGYVGAGGTLHERFAAEVQANGGVAHVVDGREAARRVIVSLLPEPSPTSALCWKHGVLDGLGIDELLSNQNIVRHDVETLSRLPPDEQRRIMLSAEVGITSADLAVAETGSLVVCSSPGTERVTSLLPPFHIAVVEQRQIVPDLFDLFDELGKRGQDALPSNLVFISGPSKTGDIELHLTTGVHGPGQWHVIIVAETA